ncbi:MAG: SAM-dependent methyltransferase [Oscillospiraceae bacterium]|nr:SAM-dependent methyltransferase [Oscillospiraceae bacterium]
MIDLYALCADLKDRRSRFRRCSNSIISEIYAYLDHPSDKTKDMIAGWKDDFRYLYGDITTNLSSNRKLDAGLLLEEYGAAVASAGDTVEALQLLFFSIQTYFSLLIKYIVQNFLQGASGKGGFSCWEIILGSFAKQYGITNYGGFDWYCWPLYELDRGFPAVMEDVRRQVENYRAPSGGPALPPGGDLIKQIYEAVIPKELRHALGEYYTPDWLAESTLKSAVEMCAPRDVRTLSIVDPTCGSGTFLTQAILLKRKSGCGLSDILATVRGIDINPLAVLTAKTNYLLSILDLTGGAEDITLPVFQGDILTTGDSAPDGLEKADIVTGNPPWVNWEYMPEKYRQETQHLWLDYGLLSAKGRDLSFSKEDISVLITYTAIDRLLKTGGVIGFVIRQGVFKSAQNGVGFRRFQVRGEGVRVLRVEDLSRLQVFEGAANAAAVFFAKKGEETVYPVPYSLWTKREGACPFGSGSSLRDAVSQIAVTQQYAMPAVWDDPTSIWITAERNRLEPMKKVLGTNRYRARTGVFTGGANAVYWLRIGHGADGRISVSNIVDRAKRKTERVTAEIEAAYVFPMLRGGNVRRWNTSYDTYLLCPHTAETKLRPVPQKELAATAPATLAYLLRFKKELDSRNGFAGWEKEIQRQEFHAVLRVGAYTFSRYKVVWKYIASEFICAVIGAADDPFLGVKTVLPNEKIMYVSTDDEMEAYYLCGVLSSTLIAECVKSYMNPTSISTHVLNKLYIPDYDKGNEVHREIALLCKSGHGKSDLSPYIKGIDGLTAQLYGV